MIFQQFLNEDSGCLSYLIGCGDAGQAIVVDPGRDRVNEYLRFARKKGLKALDGVGMLVSQGALSFEIFTGKRAPFRVMKGAVDQAMRFHRTVQGTVERAIKLTK